MSSSSFFTTSTPADHPTDFYSDDFELKSYLKNLSDAEVLEFFEVAECVEWLKELSATRVALQFPDGFLIFARRIADSLEKLLENKIKTFILADTSYRSCCIDEVAAAHASCDALIHFGEACLSAPTKNIPVKYVLGKMPIDIENLKSNVKFLNATVVLTDSIYSHLENEILSVCQSSTEMAGISKTDENLYLGRRTWKFQDTQSNLLFIGTNDTPLLPLWILSFPNFHEICHYNPIEKRMTRESTHSCRQLRRRLFLVEKLKDANTVGLVVGSVGVDKHKEAVQRMRELCKAAGKKIYVISVGKINVPKLSNFSSDIDCFVLLSCPFGVVLDSSDYYKPVVSFFEAEIALNPAKNHWAADSGWRADFGRFLNDEIAAKNDDPNSGGDISLISGKVRVQREEEVAEDGTKTMAVYTAGDYFGERSWKGLDDTVRVTNNDTTTVTEGRRGIAQGYQGK